MYVFIDESGIHKQTEHSSFVLVYLSLENIQMINDKIEAIEASLEINYFHWSDYGSKSGWSIRERFIKSMINFPFTFKYAIIKNPTKPAVMLYRSLCSLLIEKDIQKVIIDGDQPKWYEKQIKHSLNSQGLQVRKLRTANDRSMPALRLADALAGLIRSYYNGKPDAVPLYRLIKRANKITAHLEVGGQVSPLDGV